MKSVYDKVTRDELIKRIHSVNENSKAQWGKMDVHQMAKHCRLWEEMITGKVKCKRIFFGRLVGRMALKSSLKDDRPMMRNAVTSPELVVKDDGGDLAAEKAKWIALMEEGARSPHAQLEHPFFGMMTKEQVGYHAYKHNDHHLRQFGA